MLVAYPLEYRCSAASGAQYRPGELPEFTVAGAGGPGAQQVFERASGEPMTKGISGPLHEGGLREGFFKPCGDKATAQLAREESGCSG